MSIEARHDRQPDIRRLTAKMARDNDRVTCFVHGLTRHVDRLVSASQMTDWKEVRRVCEFLMKSSTVYGLDEIAQSAQRVCRALDDSEGSDEVKRSLLKLVGRCGGAGRREPVAGT